MRLAFHKSAKSIEGTLAAQEENTRPNETMTTSAHSVRSTAATVGKTRVRDILGPGRCFPRTPCAIWIPQFISVRLPITVGVCATETYAPDEVCFCSNAAPKEFRGPPPPRELCVQLLARVHHRASHSSHSVCSEQDAGSTNSTGQAQGHKTDAALSKFRRNSHLWRSLCLKPKSKCT